MNVIKRDGHEVPYNPANIINAVSKANQSVDDGSLRLTGLQIEVIEEEVRTKLQAMGRMVGIEEIQNLVIHAIMKQQAYQVAQNYTEHRFKRALARKKNSTDDAIFSLIEYENENVKEENSNKNPQILSTQRDYLAGEVSKDITKRILLPKELVEAMEKGILHFHDSDYFIQHMHNCDLVNLDDMLQNGTVITDTMIERPNSLASASNIATQIVAQVASNQYGGQTITLSHLAPFVDISRKNIRARMEEALAPSRDWAEGELEICVSRVTERTLRKEIAAAIQTIQYQLITLMTTNGQTPFVSVFMYLGEVPEGQMRDDLALLIEETLKQRILGVKNKNGDYITPAFPKLLYVLDEDNVRPGSKYYYLTKLAAECTAKRMVPDYISAKVMKDLKGDVYPCMGCVDGKETISYQYYGKTYTESFERMWYRLSEYFEVKQQPNEKDFYMETPGVKIYDQKKGFVENYGIIKNHTKKWLRLSFTNGRVLTCTPNHPFETENRGIVLAENLTPDDVVLADKLSNIVPENTLHVHRNRAWLYGFSLCDSTYYDHYVASIASTGEDDIKEMFCETLKSEFMMDVNVVNRKRGVKGYYKDLKVVPTDDDMLLNLKTKLISMFEGKAKRNRHIPNEVFSWDVESRFAFLAGMIDADGYVNDTESLTHVQIGSTNKELAIQQALLAQTLSMPAQIYINHYRENCRDYIRYRVEFVPVKELFSYLTCEKKITHVGNLSRTNSSINETNKMQLLNSESFEKDDYSYDVTTESEHFTVSGIYSHNCRSFLTPDRTTEKGNMANAKNYVPGKHKYYGRLNTLLSCPKTM